MNSLESAAFAAWPAFEERDLDGWHLRFTEGYTKRANSANSTSTSVELDAGRLAHIERLYRQSGLPTIFRLTSLDAPPNTDSFLASKAYRFTDLSLVMVAPLSVESEASAPNLVPDAQTWLNAFQKVSGKLDPDQAIHLELLQAIQSPCAFAVEHAGEEPICCGLGVCVQDQLGLFDVATSPAYQGRGLAKKLCASLLAWGRQSGAKSVFLQVTGSNTTAIRLYESLGFRRAYHYWYRVQV
jgi:GNAT superfamily N-acetyltransferase